MRDRPCAILVAVLRTGPGGKRVSRSLTGSRGHTLDMESGVRRRRSKSSFAVRWGSALQPLDDTWPRRLERVPAGAPLPRRSLARLVSRPHFAGAPCQGQTSQKPVEVGIALRYRMHRRTGGEGGIIPQRFDQGYPPRTVPCSQGGGVVMTAGRLRPSSDGGRVPRRRVPGALGPRATRRPQPRTPGPPAPARVRRPRRGSTAHRARPPEGWCPLCPCDAGTL